MNKPLNKQGVRNLDYRPPRPARSTGKPQLVVVPHDISPAYRRAIRYRAGQPGLASDAEVISHIEMVVGADAQDLCSELPEGEAK